jgi:hypothetical protein
MPRFVRSHLNRFATRIGEGGAPGFSAHGFLSSRNWRACYFRVWEFAQRFPAALWASSGPLWSRLPPLIRASTWAR